MHPWQLAHSVLIAQLCVCQIRSCPLTKFDRILLFENLEDGLDQALGQNLIIWFFEKLESWWIESSPWTKLWSNSNIFKIWNFDGLDQGQNKLDQILSLFFFSFLKKWHFDGLDQALGQVQFFENLEFRWIGSNLMLTFETF